MSQKFALLALMAILIFPFSGHGQEMTEKYIPVDAYPKLAGSNVVVGRIVSTDKDMRVFALESDDLIQNFIVADTTKIWLDRSLLKKANGDGSFADLKAGLKAEVRLLSSRQKSVAKWVKVQIPASQ